MIITRKNHEKIVQTIMTETAEAALEFVQYGAPSKLKKIQENKLILDIMRPGTKIFLGNHSPGLVNLTLYKLELRLGNTKEEALMRSMWDQVRRKKDGAFVWEGFNTYNYAKKVAKDPWNKDRRYIHINQIEGFDIECVSSGKNVIVGSLFFYDGYNIYQSIMMKFSKYGENWYMNAPKDMHYTRIESNIKTLYTIQNY